MTTVFSLMTEDLGGERRLGRKLRSLADAREAIRDGFPPSVIDSLMESAGLSLKELTTSVGISTRSLQRRRKEGRLASDESDRLYRFARLLAMAEYYIGDRGNAVQWLRRPNVSLGGSAPMQVMDTDAGVEEIESLLGRIAYGGVA
jgi:putative toxin-antitoxin system antitoxin component (TIGR02293 family)